MNIYYCTSIKGATLNSLKIGETVSPDSLKMACSLSVGSFGKKEALFYV